MGFANMGGGGGIGAAIGSAAAKVAKPRSSGSSKPARKYRSGGGGSTRRYIPERRRGGGGGGSPNMSIPENRPAAPARVKIPEIAAYLGTDSAYQNAVKSGKRSLADFLSELGRRRGEAGTQFKQTQASMERDRVQQLEDMKNEFASRGLLQSGLFGQEQGQFQQQFTEQANALKQQQAALLADLLSQEKNYRREQDLALEEARQQALARRAAKYKIGA